MTSLIYLPDQSPLYISLYYNVDVIQDNWDSVVKCVYYNLIVANMATSQRRCPFKDSVHF